MARTIIDAGHGGTARAGNSSALGSRGSSGILEKDITLDIARHVASRLGGTTLTRSDDTNLSLAARAARASRDGADVFVSIHANSGSPERSGPETWVHPEAGANSRELAGGIQRALERLAGRYGGNAESRSGQLAVLSPTVLGHRTAACLVEVDYLSNPRGEVRLGDPQQRAAIGAAIADAIREHIERHPGERFGQQGSQLMPPPQILNQVGRSHGRVLHVPAHGRDASLGFAIRGASGQVQFLVHTTATGTGTVQVRVLRNGAPVHNQTLQAGDGLHAHPVYYVPVEDGDYTIEAVNDTGAPVRVDFDLAWKPRVGQALAYQTWAEAASTPAEAAIAAFAARTGGSAFRLSRPDVANRLRDLIANPNLVDQGNLNVCGPAAFFHLWAGRAPLAFVNFAAQLFETGAANIGGLRVEAGSDLRAQTYSALRMGMPQADWMLLSALRDSENATLDFEGTPDEDVAGITTPEEIHEWMRACGCAASAAERQVQRSLDVGGAPNGVLLRPAL